MSDDSDFTLGDIVRLIDGLAATTNANFERVDARFDRIDADMGEVKERLDRMERKLDHHDTRFEALESK